MSERQRYRTSHVEPPLRDLLGHLWRVEEDCWIDTGVLGLSLRVAAPPQPGGEVDELKCDAELTHSGRLYFKKGFIHDGSSVPLLGRWLDKRVSGWPAMPHDFAYRCSRAGDEIDRPLWDGLYSKMMRAFGSWWITAKMCRVGLWLFGRKSASPENGPEYSRRA